MTKDGIPMNSSLDGGRAYARGDSKPVWHPLTEMERDRARALVRCKLPPASMTKRFAGRLNGQAGYESAQITDKQAAFLAVCCYRFRRQFQKDDATASLVPAEPPPGYETPKMARERQELERVKNKSCHSPGESS